MAVALENHHLVDLFGAELDDATDIVTSEIDEHHVLSDFFRMLPKFRTKATIFFFGCTASTSARDRTGDHTVVDQLHHWFRRRASEAQFRHTHEVHVRARVDLTKYSIEIEWISAKFKREPLREHHLKNVAVENAFLCNVDCALPLVVGHRTGDLGKFRRWSRRIDHWFSEWPRTIGRQLLEANNRFVIKLIEFAGTCAFRNKNIVDQRDALTEVVESSELSNHGHHRVGETGGIAGRFGEIFNFANHVVAEITDNSTVQWRQRIDRG